MEALGPRPVAFLLPYLFNETIVIRSEAIGTFLKLFVELVEVGTTGDRVLGLDLNQLLWVRIWGIDLTDGGSMASMPSSSSSRSASVLTQYD